MGHCRVSEVYSDPTASTVTKRCLRAHCTWAICTPDPAAHLAAYRAKGEFTGSAGAYEYMRRRAKPTPDNKRCQDRKPHPRNTSTIEPGGEPKQHHHNGVTRLQQARKPGHSTAGMKHIKSRSWSTDCCPPGYRRAHIHHRVLRRNRGAPKHMSNWGSRHCCGFGHVNAPLARVISPHQHTPSVYMLTASHRHTLALNYTDTCSLLLSQTLACMHLQHCAVGTSAHSPCEGKAYPTVSCQLNAPACHAMRPFAPATGGVQSTWGSAA